MKFIAPTLLEQNYNAATDASEIKIRTILGTLKTGIIRESFYDDAATGKRKMETIIISGLDLRDTQDSCENEFAWVLPNHPNAA